jgi:hypothetical protein
MKNLSTDPITDGAALEPVEKTFFDDLTKEAAEAPGDDEETTVGVNPEPAPVEDRSPGPDAPWGEEAGSVQDGQQPSTHFSSAARREFIRGREELLDKLFDNNSKSTEQKVISQNFKDKKYETSSPQLNKSSSVETLNEQVRRIAGRD